MIPRLGSTWCPPLILYNTWVLFAAMDPIPIDLPARFAANGLSEENQKQSWRVCGWRDPSCSLTAQIGHSSVDIPGSVAMVKCVSHHHSGACWVLLAAMALVTDGHGYLFTRTDTSLFLLHLSTKHHYEPFTGNPTGRGRALRLHAPLDDEGSLNRGVYC